MTSRASVRRAVGLGTAALLALPACGGSDAPTVPGAPAGTAGAAATATAAACTPAPLAERAARVLVVGLPNARSADEPLARRVAALGVGGLFLSPPKDVTAAELTALVSGVQARTKHALLVSTDEESGRVSLTREYVGSGPSPRRLAAQRSVAEVRSYAAGVGKSLSELGINLDLAPVLDLYDGPSSTVIGDRSFSAEPPVARDYGLAFAAGLSDSGVRPTVKHFPGQGRSTANTDRERGQVAAPLAEIRATDLVPFRAAIDAGTPVVMMSHLEYAGIDPTLPGSLSPRSYALLRSLGFQGVAITDSIGAGSINLRWDFPEAATRAITAGADAVLATDGNQATRMRDALVAAVRSGRLPEARLDEAAARVTALSGEDPLVFSCVAATTPTLRVTG